MRRVAKIAVPVVVVLAVAAFAGWWFVVRSDAPAAVGTVSEQFDTTTAAPAAATSTVGTATSPAAGTAASAASAATTTAAPASADGTWTVLTGPDVFVGYRINEQFVAGAVNSTAVGRSPGVTGTLTVAGPSVSAARIEVDMTKLASDKATRDGRMREGGLETARFPTATFTLTEPLALAAPPAVGQVVDVIAKGDLTLHGVTRPLALPLQARWTGPTIDVTGSAPIALADYGLDLSAFAGFVKVEPQGTLELAVQLARA